MTFTRQELRCGAEVVDVAPWLRRGIAQRTPCIAIQPREAVELHRALEKGGGGGSRSPSNANETKRLVPVIRWSRTAIWWHRAERSGEGSFRRLAAQTAEGGGERNRTSRHRRDRDKL